MGKSRLVAEFLGTIDGATVVRGRCLSYGDGITYWPVVEVVKQIPDASTLVEPAAWTALGALLGEGDGTATPDEIAWAFRKLLERRRRRSLCSASSTTSSGARRPSSS